MEYNFDLSIDLSQKILITPELKFALEVLKMDTQELLACIEEQLESNPMLEIVENDSLANSNEIEKLDEYDGNVENFSYDYSNVHQKGISRNDISLMSFVVDKISTMLTLKQHLLFQLHTSGLDARRIKIGEYVINNLDDNGYLIADTQDIALHFKTGIEKIEEVKAHIQTFDPSGICASSLKECLFIQLRQAGYTDTSTFNLIENYLDDLALNKVATIAKRTGMDIREVVRRLDFIKTLEPKPGRAFSSSSEVSYIIPDVIVKTSCGNLEVIINEDRIPSLGVSEYYKAAISKENMDSKEYNYYHNEIKSAQWFIKCIEQRKGTLLKVVQKIVTRQNDFFNSNSMDIKPLTAKEIAQELGIHESTVSRTVSDKYLQCSKGNFELKYFFSGKISDDEGSGMSSKSVKFKIKEMIDSEDKANPLNDSQIAELLNKQGIRISRRTVAKYRGELEIPTIDMRKKW